MQVSDFIEKESSIEEIWMAPAPERIAAIESDLKTIKGILKIIIIPLLGWGAYITVSVVSMKQSLADGGNKQIVAELKDPKSPTQLQANLYTVIAQVKTAQASGTKPNPKKIGAIDSAVAEVVKRDQNLSEGWQAAAALISYRGPSAVPSKTCDVEQNLSAASSNFSVTTLDGSFVMGLEVRDCTLVLDDPSNISVINTMNSKIVGMPTMLRMVNVHVVYRGGDLPDAKIFSFSGCTFEFQILAPPPEPARYLTEQLLAANDLSSVSINVPSA